MPNPSVVDKYLSTIITAKSNVEIKRVASDYLSNVGFYTWIYASENPGTLFGYSTLFEGVPLGWLTKYLAKGYMNIDPVVSHCRNSDDVLLWDAFEGWETEAGQIKNFLRDAYDHGFVSGMTIPLRSFSGYLGVFSLVSDKPLNEKREHYTKYSEICREIGEAIHSSMERVN